MIEFWRRLAFFFRRGQFHRDLEEEMREHLRMKAKALAEAGMSAYEARNAARRGFGNALLLREKSRDAWGFRWLETLLQDVRYGLRQLRRNPGFTAVAVITLALGIGANTAIFSLVNTLMLRPLPVQKPSQLVQFLVQGYGRTFSHFSYPYFEDFRERNDVFSGMAAVFWLSQPILDAKLGNQPESATGQLVSGNFFSLLGLRPALGRLISPDDDRTPSWTRVAVLSYAYWKRRFGGGPAALGKSIVLHGVPFTIIGVAPPGFIGVSPGFSPSLYVPMATQPVFMDGKTWLDKDSYHWLEIMARLTPGVRLERAQAEMSGIFGQMLRAGVKPRWSPKDREKFLSQKIELASAASGFSDVRRDLSRPLFLLLGMVGLVLLIACANVASMMLARAVKRRREFAVRFALGAGGSRVVRQLMTESLLLGLAGGALGLALASWLGGLLVWLVSLSQGHVEVNLHLDLRILAFTAGAALATTVLFGLAPAWRVNRVAAGTALKEDSRSASAGRGRLRLGKALVVCQIVLCTVLLFGAGLFVRTLDNLEILDAGFNRHNVILFSINPAVGGYKGEAIANLYRRVLDRLNTLPGVRSASLSEITPIEGGGWMMDVSVEDYTPRPNEDVQVDVNSVGPAFFRTLQMPLVLGRYFGPEDTEGSPKVAIINQVMAHYFFSDRNPLGRKFGWTANGVKKDFEIVGVVGDAKYLDMRESPPRTVYLDCLQDSLRGMNFEVRTASAPDAMISEIRKAVEVAAGGAEVAKFRTLDEQVEESLGHERLVATLSSLFGALALLLAAVGLYGLMAYSVAQRTNEIGIRMALGAQPGRMLAMVLGETLALGIAGIAIGLPVALLVARWISSLLFGLKSDDPATMILASAVMLAAAVFAGYLPAHRAAKVDPMVALRYE